MTTARKSARKPIPEVQVRGKIAQVFPETGIFFCDLLEVILNARRLLRNTRPAANTVAASMSCVSGVNQNGKSVVTLIVPGDLPRMKAAYIRQTGPAAVIEYGELPLPEIGSNEVLVKTTAVCVDPVDTLIRSGQLPETLRFPFIIGRDMTGTVESVGSAVTRFAIGDRVWCNNQGYGGRQGTFAEYLSIAEDQLFTLPPGVNAQDAVAFVHSGLTACLGLSDAALKTGESIFINGGAGNVGAAVLQLAKARGARVFATAGDEAGLAWCRELGADRAVNFRTENIERALREFAPNGVDVYWDASGHQDFDRAIARVARRGRIIVMCGFGDRPAFPVGDFYVKRCSMHGFAITYASEEEVRQAAAEINQWFAQGRLKVRIDRVLPLADAAAAHQLVDSHAHLGGKIVLIP